MKYKEIINEIDKKIFHPIYFLSGEEDFYIDLICDYISKNILTTEEKEFNFNILYGKEIDILRLISESKQFPFGSNYKILIVKEAQNIRNIEKLETYIKNPQKSTILILCYKNKALDKRKKFAKTIINNTIFFESKKLYESQIPSWIKEYVANKGWHIDNNSCNILSEYLGNNLSKISNEINKLMINSSIGKKITPSIIQQNIGISKDYNIFELQKALGEKDIIKCNRIINHFSKNPKNNPFILIISSLFSYFQKIIIYKTLKDKSVQNISAKLGINPYFISQYKHAVNNYSIEKLIQIFKYIKLTDLRSKGVNNNSVSEKELLKELVYKILH